MLQISLSLLSSKPKNYKATLHPAVKLHLDPKCTYRVKIQPSIIGMFAQGVRFYSLMLPAFLATVVLLTVRQQVLFLDEGKCVLFHSALSTAIRRYYIVLQAIIIGSKLLGWVSFFEHSNHKNKIIQKINAYLFIF